ncbi:MAG: YdiU family protein [Pseudanabaenaceae cyanobacterium]
MNPWLTLPYEPAFASLGPDFSVEVAAAAFPQHTLRWRNDELLPRLGLDPALVRDEDFVEAFGLFRSDRPFLAMAYHGYQFGQYNPHLGDGRGFLYGQVRGTDGRLYDLGTKGSGQTPFSRHADGRLTLKGAVREILAAEALHRLGAITSRCLCAIETGEQLWRGDEPSPTRSAVMVRLSHSHIRFGTFERLHYLQRPDLVGKLLDWTIQTYYPHLGEPGPDTYGAFYAEVVARTAVLCAQWMVAGFCHAVLNTDNLSIVGESFDYGPYAFIPTYDPGFTAAYFDDLGRYSYGNQPQACYWNLQMLQVPLQAAIAPADLETGLARFAPTYRQTYQTLFLQRLGLPPLPDDLATDLILATLKFLAVSQIGYHEFFARLRTGFAPEWRDRPAAILADGVWPGDEAINRAQIWQDLYSTALRSLPPADWEAVPTRLRQANPTTVLLRPAIEAVWEKIVTEDDWQPFQALVTALRAE